MTRIWINLLILQGSVHLYDSEGSVTDLFDVHNAEFVGVDCLTAGTRYCVVRQDFLFQVMQPRRQLPHISVPMFINILN